MVVVGVGVMREERGGEGRAALVERKKKRRGRRGEEAEKKKICDVRTRPPSAAADAVRAGSDANWLATERRTVTRTNYK